MKAEEERVGTKSINSWREHSQPPPHKTISNLVETALQMRFPPAEGPSRGDSSDRDESSHRQEHKAGVVEMRAV